MNKFIEFFHYDYSIYFKFGNLIHLSLENPFRTWWKARKYFKMPKLNICIRKLGWYFPYARYDYIGRILDISTKDVRWKDKYDSPRYEGNPYIFICLFRTICLEVNFYIPRLAETGNIEDGSSYYWEYLLNYLYYKYSLKVTDVWEYNSKIYSYTKYYGNSENGEEDRKVPFRFVVQTPLFSLNKKGLKEFNKLYE